MKAYLEKLNEAGVVTCVVVAASIAIILMIAHAVWKRLTSELPRDNQPEQPHEEVACDVPIMADPPASRNAAQSLRRELSLKNQPIPFKTTLPP
jgi:hypothetical protein